MWWLLLLTAPLSELLPCTEGLRLVYRVEAKGAPAREVVDTLRGVGPEPNSCVIESEEGGRITARMREHLPDRVSNAGFLAYPLAFRPPILKTPIRAGATWLFERTHYAIRSIDAVVKVPAGTFRDCVQVEEWTEDGRYRRTKTYAPQVGLIRWEDTQARSELIRIEKSAPILPSPPAKAKG